MSVDRYRGRWLAALAAAGNGSPEELLWGVANMVHDVTLADGVTIIGYTAEYMRPGGHRFGAVSLRHTVIRGGIGWDEDAGLYREQFDAAAAVRRHDESDQRPARNEAVLAIEQVLNQATSATPQPETASAVLNVLTGLGWTPPAGNTAADHPSEKLTHGHGLTVQGEGSPAKVMESASASPPAVGLTVSGEDFDMLCSDGTGWGTFFQDGPHRFQVLSDQRHELSWDWAMSYWVDRWGDVMILRAYLDSIGEPYQILSDESIEAVEDGSGQFVLVTNYLSPGRGKPLLKETRDRA